VIGPLDLQYYFFNGSRECCDESGFRLCLRHLTPKAGPCAEATKIARGSPWGRCVRVSLVFDGPVRNRYFRRVRGVWV